MLSRGIIAAEEGFAGAWEVDGDELSTARILEENGEGLIATWTTTISLLPDG